jgi:hypothetical protein
VSAYEQDQWPLPQEQVACAQPAGQAYWHGVGETVQVLPSWGFALGHEVASPVHWVLPQSPPPHGEHAHLPW